MIEMRTRMKNMMIKKNQMKQHIIIAPQFVKVKEWLMKSVKDVDLDEFDASTCSGDTFYDIFDKEGERITEDSIVWMNINKTIWEWRVKKPLSLICQRIPNSWNWYGLVPKKYRVFIRNCSEEYKHNNITISNHN